MAKILTPVLMFGIGHGHGHTIRLNLTLSVDSAVGLNETLMGYPILLTPGDANADGWLNEGV